MIAHAAFAEQLNELVGIPFRHQGRNAQGGVDCVGLPYLAATLCGLEMQQTPLYTLQPTEQQLTDGLAMFCDRVDDASQAHIWQVPFPGGLRHIMCPIENVDDGTLCVQANSRRGQVVRTLWRRSCVASWVIRGVEWRAPQ